MGVAKVGLQQAKTAQVDGDKTFAAAAARKAKLESALHEAFAPLKEGAADSNFSQKKAISSLVSIGKDSQLDGFMLTSLPATLAKAPADRGSFDLMVWKHFEEEITTRIRQLQEELASGESQKAERSASVEAAQTALENAQKHLESWKT